MFVECFLDKIRGRSCLLSVSLTGSEVGCVYCFLDRNRGWSCLLSISLIGSEVGRVY